MKNTKVADRSNGVDGLGIEYGGTVLNGWRTVRQLLSHRRPVPENIDPVLAFHLRLPVRRPPRF